MGWITSTWYYVLSCGCVFAWEYITAWLGRFELSTGCITYDFKACFMVAIDRGVRFGVVFFGAKRNCIMEPTLLAIRKRGCMGVNEFMAIPSSIEIRLRGCDLLRDTNLGRVRMRLIVQCDFG